MNKDGFETKKKKKGIYLSKHGTNWLLPQWEADTHPRRERNIKRPMVGVLSGQEAGSSVVSFTRQRPEVTQEEENTCETGSAAQQPTLNISK